MPKSKTRHHKGKKGARATTELEKRLTPAEERAFAEHYRHNNRQTLYGILAIVALIFMLYLLIGVDMSGCALYADDEEALADCRQYNLLEYIMYGGPYDGGEEVIEIELEEEDVESEGETGATNDAAESAEDAAENQTE